MIREDLAEIGTAMHGHFGRYTNYDNCPWTARWIVASEDGLATKRRLVRPVFESNRMEICDRIQATIEPILNIAAEEQLSLDEREGVLWIKAQARTWEHEGLESVCEKIIRISDAHITQKQCTHCADEIQAQGTKIVQEHLQPLIQSFPQASFAADTSSEQLYQEVLENGLILTKTQQTQLWVHCLEIEDSQLQDILEASLKRHALDLDVAADLATHLTELNTPFSEHLIHVLSMGYRGLTDEQLEALDPSIHKKIESNKKTFSLWREDGLTWRGQGAEQRDPVSHWKITHHRQSFYYNDCLRTEFLDPCVWEVPLEGRTAVFSYVNGAPVLTFADNGQRESDYEATQYVQLPVTTLEEGHYSDDEMLTPVGQELRQLTEMMLPSQDYSYEKQRKWEDHLFTTWFNYEPLFETCADPVLQDYANFTRPFHCFSWWNVARYRYDYVHEDAGRFDLWQGQELADNARREFAQQHEALEALHYQYQQSDYIALHRP